MTHVFWMWIWNTIIFNYLFSASQIFGFIYCNNMHEISYRNVKTAMRITHLFPINFLSLEPSFRNQEYKKNECITYIEYTVSIVTCLINLFNLQIRFHVSYRYFLFVLGLIFWSASITHVNCFLLNDFKLITINNSCIMPLFKKFSGFLVWSPLA